MITVKELIEFLKTQPQDMLVAHHMCSENCLLEIEKINIEQHCVPREDGWIPNARPDKPLIPYLMFPGN